MNLNTVISYPASRYNVTKQAFHAGSHRNVHRIHPDYIILRKRIVWVSRDILLRGRITGKLKLLFPESFKVQQMVKGNNAQYPHEQGHEQKTGQQN
jgi:hypothetical protein